MKRFSLGQRVIVRECLSASTIQLVQLPAEVAGYVYRKRSDGTGWVRLDVRTNDNVFPFPADDHRGRDVLAGPEGCRADRRRHERRMVSTSDPRKDDAT